MLTTTPNLTWLIAAALALAGVSMLILGLRGRRVGTEPRCRRCGYELTGLPATDDRRCPECGSALSASGIRHGRRRRRPLVACAGVTLAAIPLLLLAVHTQVDWVRYKPVWLLKAEAGRKGWRNPELMELLRRVRAKELSRTQVNSVIEWALDRQGNAAITWENEWGDLVEIAAVNGDVTAEQARRYIDQGVRQAFDFKIRRRVSHGATVPYEIGHDIARFGSQVVFVAQYEAAYALNDITFDQSSFALESGGWSSTRSIDVNIDIWPDLPIGKHLARAKVRTLIPAIPMAYGSLSSAERSLDFEVQRVLEVVPAGQDTVRLIVSDPLRAKLYDAIRIGKVGISPSGEVGSPVSIRNPPVGAAFRAYIRVGSAELEAGQFLWERGNGFSSILYRTAAQPPTLSALPETVTVTLRPAPDLARRSIDSEEIWGEEVIIPDVPTEKVDRFRGGGLPPPPYGPKSDHER